MIAATTAPAPGSAGNFAINAEAPARPATSRSLMDRARTTDCATVRKTMASLVSSTRT
ncbi:MAG: hypothetical protein ABI376_08370 [Caulobacteraceae bacterium]